MSTAVSAVLTNRVKYESIKRLWVLCWQAELDRFDRGKAKPGSNFIYARCYARFLVPSMETLVFLVGVVKNFPIQLFETTDSHHCS